MSPGMVTRFTANSRAASEKVPSTTRSGCWTITALMKDEMILDWSMPAGAT